MIRKFTQINESAQTYDNPLNLPPLETLGDGEFEGALWGHCFAYGNGKYYSQTGTKNIYPYKVIVTVKDGVVQRPYEFVDNFQHPDLKALFEN